MRRDGSWRELGRTAFRTQESGSKKTNFGARVEHRRAGLEHLRAGLEQLRSLNLQPLGPQLPGSCPLQSSVCHADYPSVERGFSAPHRVAAGAEVHVLFYEEAQPRMLSARIGALAPMALTTEDPAVRLLKPNMRSILVAEKDGSVAKAECHVKDCRPIGDEWRVEVDITAWEEVDRRRYPRYQVELPVRMRRVREGDDGPQLADIVAITKDVSLGGMLVAVGEDLGQGSLVEVQAALRPKDHIRVLAIVVRAQEEGHVGLEFLDFVGGARYAMHGFLSEAA